MIISPSSGRSLVLLMLLMVVASRRVLPSCDSSENQSSRRSRTNLSKSDHLYHSTEEENAVVNKVKNLYEEQPYPPWTASSKTCAQVLTGELWRMVHHVWGGKLPNKPGEPLRVLLAGGGTGMETVGLAQELLSAGLVSSELVHFDLSAASIKMAKKALEVCSGLPGLGRLKNMVRFVQGTILDMEVHKLGKFHYIRSVGVLHHLPDPLKGLKAITTHLAPQGGLGIMLYATYGRTGVYDVQALLKMLEASHDSHGVGIARKLIRSLPASSRLMQNKERVVEGIGPNSLDADLADLLLHPQDQSYTVSGIVEWLDEASLEAIEFEPPARYDISRSMRDPAILHKVLTMSKMEQYAFTELLVGDMPKHLFYAAKQGTHHGMNFSWDAILVFSRPYACMALNGALTIMGATADVSFALCPPKVQLRFQRGNGEVAKLASEVALRSIDGKTSLRGLYRKVEKSLVKAQSIKGGETGFYQSMETIYTQLHSLGMLHLQLEPVAPSVMPSLEITLK